MHVGWKSHGKTGGANGPGNRSPGFLLSAAVTGAVMLEIRMDLPLPDCHRPYARRLPNGAWVRRVVLAQPEHLTIGILSNNRWSFDSNKELQGGNRFWTQGLTS